MTNIDPISPAEVFLLFGKQFHRSSNQVQELLDQVLALVDTLQGVPWEGISARKFYSDWKAISPQIVASIETLNQAGMILKQLYDEFSRIDQVP